MRRSPGAAPVGASDRKVSHPIGRCDGGARGTRGRASYVASSTRVGGSLFAVSSASRCLRRTGGVTLARVNGLPLPFPLAARLLLYRSAGRPVRTFPPRLALGCSRVPAAPTDRPTDRPSRTEPNRVESSRVESSRAALAVLFRTSSPSLSLSATFVFSLSPSHPRAAHPPPRRPCGGRAPRRPFPSPSPLSLYRRPFAPRAASHDSALAPLQTHGVSALGRLTDLSLLAVRANRRRRESLVSCDALVTGCSSCALPRAAPSLFATRATIQTNTHTRTHTRHAHDKTRRKRFVLPLPETTTRKVSFRRCTSKCCFTGLSVRVRRRFPRRRKKAEARRFVRIWFLVCWFVLGPSRTKLRRCVDEANERE